MSFKENSLRALLCLVCCYPLVGLAVTPEENAATIQSLKDELAITKEQITDINSQTANQMEIYGYATVSMETSSRSGTNDGFNLGDFSVISEKLLSDKWRFFSELEYEDAPQIDSANLGNSSGAIFVETLNFTYLYSPQLNFRAGRFPTPAGIWSVNHYPPFVPTREVPQLIKNSIFPDFTDGVVVYGAKSFSSSFLKYNLFVGNGEGNPGEADLNSDKATGLNVALILPYFEHFEIGATVYSDTLNNGTKKDVQGAHSKIELGKFNFQGEYATANLDPVSGATTSSSGYYTQLMYELQHWAFGVRHDWYDETEGDGINPRVIDSVFANYFFTSNIVVKLEHHQIDEAAGNETLTVLSLGAYFGK